MVHVLKPCHGKSNAWWEVTACSPARGDKLESLSGRNKTGSWEGPPSTPEPTLSSHLEPGWQVSPPVSPGPLTCCTECQLGSLAGEMTGQGSSGGGTLKSITSFFNPGHSKVLTLPQGYHTFPPPHGL